MFCTGRLGNPPPPYTHTHLPLQSRASEIVGVGRGDEEADKGMVQALLDLKAGMDAAVARACAGSEAFGLALRSAFEASINAREDRPAELMAKFVDGLMRAGARGAGGAGAGGDSDVEKVLDRVMALFRCIHGKDVFEAFYKKVCAGWGGVGGAALQLSTCTLTHPSLPPGPRKAPPAGALCFHRV